MPVSEYSQKVFPSDFKEKYAMYDWGHASTILRHDFEEQFQDIVHILSEFKLYKSMITVGGGGKSQVAGLFDKPLYQKGWTEKQFAIAVSIDEVQHDTPTHKVDCVKGRVALDVEWNNKTEFYDRDLNNFRLLHGLQAISIGVIITRTTELQKEIFKPLGIASKYGSSTTHLDKLIPKIEGGGPGGCPVLVVAIKPSCYEADI